LRSSFGPQYCRLRCGIVRCCGQATVRTGSGPKFIALFASTVGLSHRNLDDVERRFQNPGSDRPIVVPPGRIPVLLGLWDDDPLIHVTRPVLVAADAERRAGFITRFSVFADLSDLRRTSAEGWVEDYNDNGELIPCFEPALLPLWVEMLDGDVRVPAEPIRVAAEASGLTDLPSGAALPDPARDRLRRSTSALVRDARFSRAVIAAYDGLCAACGLNLGLVQGAHIYPASAPGSIDHVTNGLALCANHHLMFDQHKLWVHPASRAIAVHPEMSSPPGGSASAQFVARTQAQLSIPRDASHAPQQMMFERRYGYFTGLYAWAS